MTYEDFWDGDPLIAKYYREAEELRNAKRNTELWLQGMYVYEAIIDIAPILHAFSKKGARAKPYPDRPYPLSSKERKQAKIRNERAIHDKGLRFMHAIMNETQAKFAQQSDEI